METVHVRQMSHGEWAAFVGDRQVTKRLCKNCIINMIKKMTSKSVRYNKIIVYNADGSTDTYSTGADNGGKAKDTE